MPDLTRPPRWRSVRTWLEWAAVAVALWLLLRRLGDLDLAPFIQDEPLFLGAARDQLGPTGHWVSKSPISGSVPGVFYGPSVIWFYGAVQWVFGSAARTCLAAMCLLVTLAHGTLAVFLSRRFALGRLGFAALTAFIASSPHQYFWSRLAWDQLTNAIPFLVVALLCAERIGPLRAVALGALLGVGLSSHPMIVPFIASVGLVLFVEHLRRPKALALIAVPSLAVLVFINVPWLLTLRGTGLRAQARPVSEWQPERWLETFRTAGFWHIHYFFDGDWPSFLTAQPFPGDPGSWATFCLVLAIAFFVGGAVGWRGASAAQRRLIALMGLVSIAAPLFLGWRGVAREPHYQFPVGWLPYVGVASALAFCARLQGRKRVIALATAFSLLLLATLIQLTFLFSWNGWIAERGGTRGPHYSTPLGQQVEAMRATCALPGPRVVLENETGIFPYPLQYHAAVEPSCAGKQVGLCGYGCQVPPEAKVTIRYAGPEGGAITFDPR